MNKYTILAVVLLAVTVRAFTQDIDREQLEYHVHYLASDEMLGRGFGSPEGIAAADYIIGEFKKAGVEPLLEDYRHPFMYRTGNLNIYGNNIVGVVEGSDPDLKDEYIILGAHYDHVGYEIEEGDTIPYNGADDNASGVAGVIELGRWFSQHRDQLRRSVILMAFDGEETGLIGSRRFVDDQMMDFEKVVAMFSLDMIGMYEKHGGLDLLGMDLIRESEELVEAARTRVPITISKTTGSLVYRTDSQPFGKLGIPAVHVFTGTESPYHKPEDDSDLLDYEGMTLIVNFMAALVMEISTAEAATPVAKMESMDREGKMKVFNPALMVNLGSTYHDYKDEFFKAKPVFAGGVGFSFETRLAQWLAIQPEVLYEWTGSQNAAGDFRTHSVTVPLSFLLTTPDNGNNGVRSYFQVGGYYSYTFAGTLGGTDLDFDSEYSDMEYGYVIGAGMEILKFRIGFYSFTSLTNRFRDVASGNLRTHGNFARIGWAF